MVIMEYMRQPDLGLYARDLRKSKGVTQEELAEMIGVTRQTIINFECGLTQSMEVLQGYLKLRGGEYET